MLQSLADFIFLTEMERMCRTLFFHKRSFKYQIKLEQEYLCVKKHSSTCMMYFSVENGSMDLTRVSGLYSLQIL